MKTANGNRCYSSYVTASFDIPCKASVTLTPSVGFTPWKGYYYNKAAFTDISLKASKSLVLNDNLSLPLYVQAIVSPINDHVYLVAGMGLSLEYN